MDAETKILIANLRAHLYRSIEYHRCYQEITTREDLIDCCIVYDFDDEKIEIYPAYEENDNCLILLKNSRLREILNKFD